MRTQNVVLGHAPEVLQSDILTMSNQRSFLDKVARDVNIMPRSIMLKGSRERRVSELSSAFVCLFNFASFDNCGDNPQAPAANFLCLVSGVTASLTSSHCRRSGFAPFVVQVTLMRRHSLGQNSSWFGMTALRSKPCFLWRAYVVPPYEQVVHPDLTPHYLVVKHE